MSLTNLLPVSFDLILFIFQIFIQRYHQKNKFPHCLLNLMEYGRSGSFPFDFELHGIPFWFEI